MARSYWWHVFLPDGDVFVERESMVEVPPHRVQAYESGARMLVRPDLKLHVWIGEGDKTYEDFVTTSSSVAGQQILEAARIGAVMAVESKVEQPTNAVHFWEDADGRKIYFANEAESTFGHSARTLFGESGLWVLWFVNWSPLYVAVWADSLEDALEEAAGFVKDSGLAHPFESDADMEEHYNDALQDLEKEGHNPDASETEERARDMAETDLTYTESGWLPSDQWGFLFDPAQTPPELREVAERLGRLVNDEFYETESDDG